MPRTRKTPTADHGQGSPARADVPFVLHPFGWYRLHHLRPMGLTENSLKREIRNARLRVSRRCGCYHILGIWIIEWLQGGEVRRYAKDRGQRVEAN